jgi:peptide/nickel transport system substrate-binding protein
VARYEAAQEWFDEKDHLVISNGPFYLEQFESTANFAELDAFRDPTYPFKPGDLYAGRRPLTVGEVSSRVFPGETPRRPR